ncbi:MAG: hypothetical protein E7509_03460 [Ruminococcus sp.]|nr:hypothetical protein [Ruminococcus sp.]
MKNTNNVYIIRIGEDKGEESRYLYSKRVCVHFPEYATKYSCWESAYHGYINSDYFADGEEATYLIYNKSTGEITEVKKRKIQA